MGRRQGILWILVGIALAGLSAIIVYKATAIPTWKSGPTPKTQPVIVAAQDVERGIILQPDMVEVREVPEDIVPQDAAQSIDEVVGKMPQVDLKKGEIILKSRLVLPTHAVSDLGLVIPPGKVVVALPANDLLNEVQMLQPGDHVNIMFSLNYGAGTPAELVTLNVLQNVVVQAIVAPPTAEVSQDLADAMGASEELQAAQPTRALLVAVDPQDALLLKYLKDAGGVLDFALRPEDDPSTPFLDPVHWEYLIDRFGLELPAPAGEVTGTTPASPTLP